MAFRRKIRLPESVKKRHREEKVAADFAYAENVLGPLMGLNEEDLKADEDAFKACICPMKNCPVHPD